MKSDIIMIDNRGGWFEKAIAEIRKASVYEELLIPQ